MNKSSRRITLVIVALILCAIQVTAQRAGNKRIAQPQKSERENIEGIVREYLIKNPEVIREAMQALQAKEVAQKQLTTAESLKQLRAEIYSSADAPVVGNEKGDVSVVVFYDYFCGYCRKSLPSLQSLIANDRSVRVVFKELPILGPQSITAAKAALAAQRQGKFTEFHQALLESESASEEAIKAISDKLHLDWARLQTDMNDPEISAMIERNQKLAAALNIEGTPAYLVGNQIIPGAIDSESLARLIKDERVKLAKVELDKK